MKKKREYIDTKAQIEFTVSRIDHKPRKCKDEAKFAIRLLVQGERIYRSGQVVDLQGQITIDDCKIGRTTFTDYHSVALLDDRWIVDISQIPWRRVYDSMQEYYCMVSRNLS